MFSQPTHESGGMTAAQITELNTATTTNGTQATAIATNTTNIATNLSTNNTQTTNIATNATNIATNTTNIGILQGTTTSHASTISANSSNISTNGTDIDNLELVNNDYMFVNYINKLGTTTRTTGNKINTTTTLQDVGWDYSNAVIGTANRISWVGTDGYEFQTNLNGLYDVRCMIQMTLEVGTSAGERFCGLQLVDNNGVDKFICYEQIAYTPDYTSSNYVCLTANFILDMDTTKQYRFRVNSKTSAQGAIYATANKEDTYHFLYVKRIK
jgi:hypothetical protein